MRAEKFCLNCRELIKGRSDKKFCGDHCRSNFNYNQTGADHLNFVRNVNRTLRRNRNILKALNKKGRTKVPKKSLSDRGFNFCYHTNILETSQRNRYYFCYEMGYLSLDDHEVLLISRELVSAK